MNFKKLITSVVFVLGTWMSVGLAMAQTTNYDFNYTSDGRSISGVFGVNGNIITNMTGTVTGFGNSTPTITELTAVNGFRRNDNVYLPSVSGPYLSTTGVSFSTADKNYNLYYFPPFTVYILSDGGNAFFGSMTSSVSSVSVPEIDGALAPQVGCLLACLFLIFGRKKENTDSLMTA